MQGWQLSQRYSAFSDTSSRLLVGKLLTNKENLLSNYDRLMILRHPRISFCDPTDLYK